MLPHSPSLQYSAIIDKHWGNVTQVKEFTSHASAVIGRTVIAQTQGIRNKNNWKMIRQRVISQYKNFTIS